MRSALDTHDYEPNPYPTQQQEMQSPVKQPPVTLNVKKSRAVKVRDLSSDLLGTGDTM